ncbi:toll/interleukin-1 receptor-like protein [Eucalyptus grandis]|uniref:toll/interleukin-1 receptor-like protein n=1 Tax=Eucalyptus grandis TaxID=71139 RepID=UPI00192EFB24|nr:toll/interleukin-1 receptor-like protein [Eucalyptus grandis]
MLVMASPLPSTWCGQLRKPEFCHASQSSRQLEVVSTKRNTTRTLHSTVSRKEGMVAAATQSSGRGSKFAVIKSVSKEVFPQLSFTIAFLPSYDQILKFAIEKFKSIIGIHGQHPPRIFDVVISYKRKDTGDFVSHLKAALERRGIRTFVDYILDEGEEILPAIEAVIKQSNIAVVVVSQHFHTSPWCLNELVKILDCQKKQGLIVFPIFWGIDARELREQSSPFVENIGQGEEGFEQEKPRRVWRWKKALRALGKINGFPVSACSDKNEAELVEDLADKISAKLTR